MCTSFKFKGVMGRNYDYDQSFDEEVIIIPAAEVSYGDGFVTNNSIIGIGTGFVKEYPLLYDGMNQYGLCCSGLAFSGNAHYFPYDKDKFNVAPWEFPLWVLGDYKDVKGLKDDLDSINILDKPYSEMFPNSDLHWFICDSNESVVVESTANGFEWYENPFNALTNNPTFENQLSEYKYELTKIGNDAYWDHYPCIDEFKSRGTETYNVKGDYTSIGRFQKTAFLIDKMSENSAKDTVVDTFHILSNVEQCNGLTAVGDKYEYTIYSVAYDMNNKMVYVKTYDNLDVKKYSLVQNGVIQRFNLKG